MPIMNYTNGVVLFLIILSVIGSGVWVMNNVQTHTKSYEYTVSTEKLTDRQYAESQTYKLSELSSAEQKLLQDAFSETDSFFSGSSVTIERESKIDTKLNWSTVTVNGTPIMVSIEEKTKSTLTPERFLSEAIVVVIHIIGTIALGVIYTEIWREPQNNTSVGMNIKDI